MDEIFGADAGFVRAFIRFYPQYRVSVMRSHDIYEWKVAIERVYTLDTKEHLGVYDNPKEAVAMIKLLKIAEESKENEQ